MPITDPEIKADDVAGGGLATEQAIEAIRGLIFSRELLPGEQIRQNNLALKLGLSRSPLREALRSLAAEGLVSYSPNRGYFVARLSREELSQIYLMRDVLEKELLSRIPRVGTAMIGQLRALNKDMAAWAERGAITRLLLANRSFHEQILGLAGMDLVARNVQTLWSLSESYRASYLWSPEHRSRVIAEHALMIDAVDMHDVAALVRIARQHRHASAQAVLASLPGADAETSEDRRR